MTRTLFDKLRVRSTGSSEPAPMDYSAKASLYERDDKLIICSMRWIAETGSPTVLDVHCDDRAIGEAIVRHLAEYSPESMNLSANKKTDWPAFKVSGARSIKTFEQQLWRVRLASMNSAVLMWAAPYLASKKHDLSIYASASNSDPAAIGAAVRLALGTAKLLMEDGGI